ncbi:MAG: ion transporter, partial [Lachnospiraceae bacterium]|nr:ion transporter [Lachnospiraceae bacterium]
EAQPEVFQNGFSGIWWAASTLLTVGYGDIFPVTNAGRIMGIFITFLGVGVVAIPTGIISAGFVEQYTRLKRLGSGHKNDDVHFITLEIGSKDKWTGKSIKELSLPKGAIIVAVERKGHTEIPRGDLILLQGDRLILAAESLKNATSIQIREETITAKSPWNGVKIRDLDISRQTFIVMVKRGKRTLIPRGELTLAENDVVLLYEKHGQRNAEADE